MARARCDANVPPTALLGDCHLGVSDRGGVERGRQRRVHLEQLRTHAGQYEEQRHRRRRKRPLPPLQGRRRPDETRPRRDRLPVLDLLAFRKGPGSRTGLDFYSRLADELRANGRLRRARTPISSRRSSHSGGHSRFGSFSLPLASCGAPRAHCAGPPGYPRTQSGRAP